MKEKLAKVAITEKANETLTKMLEIINKDSLTKIKKQNLLSWIVINYQKKHFSKSISKIKIETTDDLTKLKNLVFQIEKNKREGKEAILDLKDLKSIHKHFK